MIQEAKSSARPGRSLSEAASAIYDREMNLAALAGVEPDIDASLHLSMLDSPQNAYVRPDDDPYRSDLMARWIAMTPPTTNDRRLSSMHKAYIVT
jgi:hypothetical protein